MSGAEGRAGGGPGTLGADGRRGGRPETLGVDGQAGGGLETLGADGRAGGGPRMLEAGARGRVLAICTLDLMAAVLLRPWFQALREGGWELHIACSRSGASYFEALERDGFRMHEVALRRRLNPLVHLKPLIQLYRLLRRERFTVVNIHSPVAAAVGRLAAWLARAPIVVYTVHGFYFHEHMPRLERALFVTLEWLLGRITRQFMFVSEEDRRTALATGIAASESLTHTIYNGVDLDRYTPAGPGDATRLEVRRELGIAPAAPVVGIVGRVVREKGYREFARMAGRVLQRRPETVFLVVGDSLPSDRDQFAGQLRRDLERAGLIGSFRFTGFTPRIPEMLRAMDIFVLPSYREGFPRSVLEAMATGLATVATRIRGSREAVVEGETGHLVAVGDDAALAGAVLELLAHPERARAMGQAGRRRAEQCYDERLVQRRFREIFDALGSLPARGPDAPWRPRLGWTRRAVDVVVAGAAGAPSSPRHEAGWTRRAVDVVVAGAAGAPSSPRHEAGWTRRAVDVVAAGAALLGLAPIEALIAAALAVSFRGRVLFRQTRTGLGGRRFTLYKFRSMSEERSGTGELLGDNERLTRLGRWLRATSLDELPQLWNVLTGDMTLVGPRPLLPEYLARYTPAQRRRHEVLPGLTGWAQVNGRNAIGWERKFELDVWYVDHRSVWLDLKILALTALRVMGRAGISQPGSATMTEFLGAQE